MALTTGPNRHVSAALLLVASAALLASLVRAANEGSASGAGAAAAAAAAAAASTLSGIGSSLSSAANSAATNIPGGRTVSGALASSADGVSRWLAPDGPIQPAVTAIGGLPMRGAELINQGISQLSSGLDGTAGSLANSAGNDGSRRMPGLETLESSMPASFASLGSMMHGAIQQKNNFIRNQAEKGVQAGERLKNMMAGGLQGMQTRNSGHMASAVNMVGSVQDSLMRSGSQLTSQLEQSLGSSMGRLQGVQGIGQNVIHQAQGIGQTLTNGLTGTIGHLQRTGQQVGRQLQSGFEQNMGAVSGIVGSMQGSMSNMGQSMQNNLAGAFQQAQSTAQQVGNQLKQAATGPLNMLQGLSTGLGSLMQGATSGGSASYGGGSRGRY